MAANTSPIFVLTPNIGHASVAEANTASDGSGSLTTLFTAGAEGSRVEYIRYINAQQSAAASSAMVIRVFVTDAAGNNPRLLTEVALGAATRSTSAIGANGTISFANGLHLKSGQIIKVCQSIYAGVQDLMHYTAVGGDY